MIEYGCRNKPRPLSGADVFDGAKTYGKIVATTQWNGIDGKKLPDGYPVACQYTMSHANDKYCDGCKWQNTLVKTK